MNAKSKHNLHIASRQPRYGLRKFKRGAASVLLGTTLFLWGCASTVHAENTSNGSIAVGNTKENDVPANNPADETAARDVTYNGRTYRLQGKLDNYSDEDILKKLPTTDISQEDLKKLGFKNDEFFGVDIDGSNQLVTNKDVKQFIGPNDVLIFLQHYSNKQQYLAISGALPLHNEDGSVKSLIDQLKNADINIIVSEYYGGRIVVSPDKPQLNFREQDLNKTVKRTITVKKPSGSTTTNEQSVKFSRNGVSEKKPELQISNGKASVGMSESRGYDINGDGEIDYKPWESSQAWQAMTGNFEQFDIPEIADYKAVLDPDVDLNAAINAGQEDQTIKISYTKTSDESEGGKDQDSESTNTDKQQLILIRYVDSGGNVINTTSKNGKVGEVITDNVPAGYTTTDGKTAISHTIAANESLLTINVIRQAVSDTGQQVPPTETVVDNGNEEVTQPTKPVEEQPTESEAIKEPEESKPDASTGLVKPSEVKTAVRVKPAVTGKTQEAELPQTGNKQAGLIGLAFAAAGLLLGLSGKRKKD